MNHRQKFVEHAKFFRKKELRKRKLMQLENLAIPDDGLIEELDELIRSLDIDSVITPLDMANARQMIDSLTKFFKLNGQNDI